MAKNWRNLYDRIPADRRARIEDQVASDLAEMRLAELRRARQLTQEQLARTLDVNQAWVSKLERQTDMYLSTLRSYVEAMGGELDIVIRFGNHAVRLAQIEDISGRVGGPIESAAAPAIAPAAATSMPQVNVWNTPEDRRIWQSDDRSNTTRPQTPGQNTPRARVAA
jgi:transcriptional regulator with XRE-family HTH domain